jgi:endonuclease/exonuclease/phosphatase family metal-dependent hydrolase
MEEIPISFRLMTYNIGWGRTQTQPNIANVTKVISDIAPDILGIQEAAEWVNAERNIYSVVNKISDELGRFRGAYYGATVSMRENFHSRRKAFRDALFNDYLDWSQGNALLSKWNFSRLGDSSILGAPHNIPIFQPLQFKGNRDTDPRNAILARIMDGKINPFAITTHLSTLAGERESVTEKTPSIVNKAKLMRKQQVNNLLEVIQEHLLTSDKVVFLLGDFNANENEDCLKKLIEVGFAYIKPINNHVPTHQFEMAQPIDHIFVYPASRVIQYECKIVDSLLARDASDHLPVVADVLFKSA